MTLMCVKVRKSRAHKSVLLRPPQSSLDLNCLPVRPTGNTRQTHLQVGTRGKHTSTVHGFDCVAVQRGGRFGDDRRLGGG